MVEHLTVDQAAVGSNPTSHPILKNLQALVAQLDRASDFGSEGWGFESSQAHQALIFLTLFLLNDTMNRSNRYNVCRGGGIGRHAWLRSMWDIKHPVGVQVPPPAPDGPLAQSAEQLTLNQ